MMVIMLVDATIDRAGVILKAIVREMSVDEDPSSEEEGEAFFWSVGCEVHAFSGDGDNESSNAMSVDLECSSASEDHQESDQEEEEESGAISTIFGHENPTDLCNFSRRPIPQRG